MSIPRSTETPVVVTNRPLRVSSRQVALLCALDEQANLRRAAEAIHTTQSAASALLQQLEQVLGVTLFERHARGMRPTAFGEVMIRYARSVRHDFDHAEAEIKALDQGAAGLVRIGSVMGSVPSVLARSLSAFKARYPRVRLSIQVDTSDLLIPSLQRGDLDVVLGRLPDQFEHDSLDVEPFEEGEPMSIVARSGHPLFAKPRPKMADLVHHTWLLHPTGSPMRRRVEAALQNANFTQAVDIVETASILATTALIEVTDMISVVPRDVAQHYARYGLLRIVPVELPIAMAHLGIVTRKARDLSPATHRFLECLREALSQPLPIVD